MFLLLTLTYFTSFSSVSIVHFEQLSVSWVVSCSPINATLKASLNISTGHRATCFITDTNARREVKKYLKLPTSQNLQAFGKHSLSSSGFYFYEHVHR